MNFALGSLEWGFSDTLKSLKLVLAPAYASKATPCSRNSGLCAAAIKPHGVCDEKTVQNPQRAFQRHFLHPCT